MGVCRITRDGVGNRNRAFRDGFYSVSVRVKVSQQAGRQCRTTLEGIEGNMLARLSG